MKRIYFDLKDTTFVTSDSLYRPFHIIFSNKCLLAVAKVLRVPHYTDTLTITPRSLEIDYYILTTIYYICPLHFDHRIFQCINLSVYLINEIIQTHPAYIGFPILSPRVFLRNSITIHRNPSYYIPPLFTLAIIGYKRYKDSSL